MDRMMILSLLLTLGVAKMFWSIYVITRTDATYVVVTAMWLFAIGTVISIIVLAPLLNR